MTNSRRDPAIPKALADHLPRHLLALEVQYKLHSEPTPRIVVISGFAVAHRGLLFWITAAHCLESLKKLRNAAGVELGPVRLHDQFPHPAAQAIPIDLDSMLQYAFGDPVTDGGIALPRQMVQAHLIHRKSEIRRAGRPPSNVQGCVQGSPRRSTKALQWVKKLPAFGSAATVRFAWLLAASR
ncbi:MAG: hypothetical protein ACK501_05940 [Planctomycetota bacterium]|jgi:hypothetical protein